MAQLLADELGMGRAVTVNLALAKMNSTPLIEASGDFAERRARRRLG